MNKTKTEKQHTVPQFILRNFATDNIIYTYDKSIHKSYKSNVKDSCCERSFYDIRLHVDGKLVETTIEDILSEIERKASPVIKNILANDSVLDITEKDKNGVVKFLATQMFRTQNIKQNLKSVPEQVRNAVKERVPDFISDASIDESFPDFNDEDLNLYFDSTILDGISRLEPYFKDLEWILVKTDEKKPFLIGDSPVVTFNELYHDHKELFDFLKQSIAYKGSCVFFPLSPTRALWLVHHEVIEKYTKNAKEILKLYFSGLSNVKYDLTVESKIQDMISKDEGFTKTGVITLSAQEVNKYNFLEITRAERKVFSKYPNFEQVEEIVKKNDFYRHGMRMLCE